MRYHVKWINSNIMLTMYPDSDKIGKEVVEENNLGVFIMRLVSDKCIVIQCEPI